MKNQRKVAFLVLTFVSLIWGVASPVIKYTLNYLPAYSFLYWRFLISSLIFLPFFFYFSKKNPVKKQDWLKMIFLGFLSTPLNLILLFLGYEKTTSMDGVLISATTPIFITLGGALFLNEKVTKIERWGLLIASLGTVISVSQPILEKGLLSGSFYGNFLVFVSVIAWVFYTLCAKKTNFKYPPLIPTAIGFFVGLITILPIALLKEGPVIFNLSALIANPNAFAGVLYMTILSSVVAYTLYLYGVSLIEASEATLFAYLQPIFAAPVASWWLGEKMTLPFLIGAFFIALGVVLSQIKTKRAEN